VSGASSAALLESVRVALSHELAQPLAVARGYVELLQSRDDEAMRAMAPVRIREAIERATLLADDVVRLIDLEAHPEAEPVAGPEALAAARSRVAGLAASRSVAIAEEGLPPTVDGVALGAMLACAVERAERGTTVVVAGTAGEIAVRWEGEELPDPVARRAVEEPWSGSAASLAPHLARRRLVLAGADLRVGPRELAAVGLA
jgi:signal transduction histidine kinase